MQNKSATDTPSDRTLSPATFYEVDEKDTFGVDISLNDILGPWSKTEESTPEVVFVETKEPFPTLKAGVEPEPVQIPEAFKLEPGEIIEREPIGITTKVSSIGCLTEAQWREVREEALELFGKLLDRRNIPVAEVFDLILEASARATVLRDNAKLHTGDKATSLQKFRIEAVEDERVEV